MSDLDKTPCHECGESLPHLCDPMPAYGCLLCSSTAMIVRLLNHDGSIAPEGWFFSCRKHHKGTSIAPFVEREDGTTGIVAGCRWGDA